MLGIGVHVHITPSSGKLRTDLLERMVTRAVDHDDGLRRTLRDDAPQHVAEQVNRLVDDRDEDARRGLVRFAPRLVSPGQDDLDHPEGPHDGGEDREQVQRSALDDGVAHLQQEHEHQQTPGTRATASHADALAIDVRA
ncbi:MAG TPA: hypothetical protein VKP64_00860 [Mycobacteriales bacterium]|nr:hypothetical protein [Mycobacteriales bacterium]